MRFRCLAASAALLLLPTVALAQEECPDGDWFCENPPSAGDDGAAGEAESPPPRENEAEPQKEGPPLVVYTPKGSAKPSKVIVVEKPPPKAAKPRKVREWGFNLHLSGALMGDKADEHDAEMGGLGFAFRYRPIRALAIDAGLELIGGTDWNGFERRETGFMTNCLLFFNPKDKVQVFWFGGFGLSGARVQVETDTESFEERYSYFGLQTGLGIEGRVSKKVALGADILGFVRGRSDARPNSRPEFVDEDTHQATNASGGGLIRGGVTFYW
ncbi:MAG TPA: hypothetical protein VM686_14035 [Polyangiaceae bacterium]|nr:hypothetical protein [Polyangiaceae bacterium]